MTKRIVGIMFGGPAALALFAKLDDRLDLNPLLERLVLNFEVASNYAWARVSSIINYDLTPFSSVLTVLTLLMVPVAISIFKQALHTPASNTDQETLTETRIRILNAAVSFVFLAYILTMFRMPVLIPIMTIFGAMISTGGNHFNWYKHAGSNPERILHLFGVVVFTVFGLVMIPVATYSAVVMNHTELRGHLQWWIFPLLSYPLSILFWYATDHCTETLTNVALCVTGIFIINWVAVTGIPYLEGLFNTIGI